MHPIFGCDWEAERQGVAGRCTGPILHESLRLKRRITQGSFSSELTKNTKGLTVQSGIGKYCCVICTSIAYTYFEVKLY